MRERWSGGGGGEEGKGAPPAARRTRPAVRRGAARAARAARCREEGWEVKEGGRQRGRGGGGRGRGQVRGRSEARRGARAARERRREGGAFETAGRATAGGREGGLGARRAVARVRWELPPPQLESLTLLPPFPLPPSPSLSPPCACSHVGFGGGPPCYRGRPRRHDGPHGHLPADDRLHEAGGAQQEDRERGRGTHAPRGAALACEGICWTSRKAGGRGMKRSGGCHSHAWLPPSARPAAAICARACHSDPRERASERESPSISPSPPPPARPPATC